MKKGTHLGFGCVPEKCGRLFSFNESVGVLEFPDGGSHGRDCFLCESYRFMNICLVDHFLGDIVVIVDKTGEFL